MMRRQRRKADAYARVLALFRRLLARPRRRGRTPARLASDELLALARRQLTVDEYLDAKMERALEPLKAILLDDDIVHVRACLREHLRTQDRWRRVARQLQRLVDFLNRGR
jgi:hypothetical protein